MLEIILYAIGFFIFTIFLQWLLHKVRKNHNQGNSAIWVGSIVGDEVGKQAGWQ